MYWNKLLVSSTKARTLVVVRLSGPCAALLRSWSTRRPPHCLRGLRRTSPLLLFYEKIPLLNLPTFSRPVTSSMVLGLFYWSVWKCPRTLLTGTFREARLSIRNIYLICATASRCLDHVLQNQVWVTAQSFNSPCGIGRARPGQTFVRQSATTLPIAFYFTILW